MKLNLTCRKYYFIWPVVLFAFLLLCGRADALSFGAREVAHFERELLSSAREVLKQPGEFIAAGYCLELRNQTIRNMAIKEATLVFSGLQGGDLLTYANGDFDFADLQKIGPIEVVAAIELVAIQNILNREINRRPAQRRIFDAITLESGQQQVLVRGTIDLKKVPGNPFVFLPQQMSPFTVSLGVRVEGSLILLEIYDGQMNSQPLTPELRKMLLDWLNPLWDFSCLSYGASISQLQITPAVIKISGSLFQ